MLVTRSVVETEEVAPLPIKLAICCAFRFSQIAMVTVITIVIILSSLLVRAHGLV